MLAVAINRNRTSGERLFYKSGYYHAVATGLSRSHSIEKSDDGGRQFFFAPVSERQELVDRFRAGVAPTSLGRRTHNEVAVFLKWDIGAQPIHFRRRGNQDPLLFLVCQRQHYFGAAHVRLDCAHRTLNDQLYTHRCRQVKDYVTLIDEFSRYRLIVNRIDRVVELRITFQVLNIVDGSGR